MKGPMAAAGVILSLLLSRNVVAQSKPPKDHFSASQGVPYIYEAKAEYVVGTNPEKMAGMPCRTHKRDIPFLPTGCKTGYLIACPDNAVFTFSKKKQWECPMRDNDAEVAVPYDNMTALARGQPQNKLSNITSIGGAATLGSGLSALATKNQWVGIGAAAAAGATLLFTYRYYEKQNYLAIFFQDPESGPCPPCTKRQRNTSRQAIQDGKVYFPRGQVAVFQINNGHDFWNISMILNAKTGLGFESEAVTIGGK